MANQHDHIDLDDPFVQRSIKAATHVRRYLPFYAFTLVWALMLGLFPSVRSAFDGGGGSGSDQVATVQGGVTGGNRSGGFGGDLAGADGGAVTDGTAGGGPSGGALTSSGRSTGGGGRTAGASGTAAASRPTAANVQESVRIATESVEGTTRGGYECKQGLRQFPISRYAIQCRAAWSGNNGGATYDGVTKDKIRIVRRVFPESANSRAADEINSQAGFASDEVADQVREVFIGYFQKVYETYGRQVEIIEWESQNGDSTAEAQSQGREGACQDATAIKKELKAFAVVGSSQPFAECAAELGMMVFRGGAYFPHSWYAKYHPFIWHGLMDCERISYQVGEYVGKRLMGRKAAFAGDPLFQQRERYFATYVPDNDHYQHCVNVFKNELKTKYGMKDTGAQFNYTLDLSRFPDQAAQAAVQFKAAGATTIILACDPYSVIFLTQASTRQQYFPEWYIIGVAAQDTDNLARLYDQENVDGHLFGMSQLGRTETIIGPQSEPGQVYKHITGKEIPDGTTGSYYDYVQVFNFIQAAGPNLTPDAIAAGVRRIIPGGAPDFPVGYISWQDGPDGTPGAGDYTGIDDSREIYWVCGGPTGACTEPAPDGKEGTFHETYNGKRFRNGEWPAEQPPVYPNR